jgi:protein-glutamine gamma-glutamyltransferase
VTAIQKDDSMAFAVDADPSLMPATPYWRMIVLDEYFGEGFRMSAGLRQDFESGRERLVTHAGFRQGAPGGETWVVWYQPGVSRYLPLLGAFNLISFSEAQGLQQSRALRLAVLSADSSKVIGYRIEGMDMTGTLPDPAFERRLTGQPEEDAQEESPRKRWRRWREMEGEPPPPPTFKELGLEQELDRTRLAAWVEQFGGHGAGGIELARRAARWLQDEHQYSLNSVIPEGAGDPLVRWIGSDRRGCRRAW